MPNGEDDGAGADSEDGGEVGALQLSPRDKPRKKVPGWKPAFATSGDRGTWLREAMVQVPSPLKPRDVRPGAFDIPRALRGDVSLLSPFQSPRAARGAPPRQVISMSGSTSSQQPLLEGQLQRIPFDL